MSIFTHLALELHLLFCPRCASALRRYRLGRELLASSFQDPELKIPSLELPDLGSPVMARLFDDKSFSEQQEGAVDALSFRRWVITGCVIVISLVSVFFCLDFMELSASAGSSLIIPMGLTIGIFISAYSALFIGSHLKELSERFNLR